MSELIDFLHTADIEYYENVSLKDLSSFKIGGQANTVCYPDSAEQVSALVKYCRKNSVQYFAFGRCSNVLFPDEGLRTLIIKTDRINDICFDGTVFSFGAGVMLAKASKYTVDNSYQGMEFSYGIPGSIGGAVFMNAGAYGGEMSQCVVKTEYVDDRGNICTLERNEHDFGYRHSFFSDKNFIITKVYVLLEKGDRERSENLIRDLQTARKNKQPLDLPSAGSVFKRPEGSFAGKLIEDSGLKGAKVGGAMVSTKHCGFIVNYDNATSSDVKELILMIQHRVNEKFGIKLECELKFIGD